MSFTIQSSPPDVITAGAAEQPDAVALSADEIRNCFPGRVAMVVDGEENIVLEDAPLIGILIELSELWLQLERGAPAAEVVDFYGEYKLVLRKRGGFVECENEFAADALRVPAETFVAAARQWARDVLTAVEQRFPRIRHNANYERLKAFVLETWQIEEER